MRLLVLGFLLSLPLASLHAADAPASMTAEGEAWRHARPAIRVEVRPLKDAGQFLVEARIANRVGGEVLAAPRMTVRAGHDATIEVGASGVPDFVGVRLTVHVDADGRSARYVGEVLQGGEVTSSHEATIRLVR